MYRTKQKKKTKYYTRTTWIYKIILICRDIEDKQQSITYNPENEVQYILWTTQHPTQQKHWHEDTTMTVTKLLQRTSKKTLLLCCLDMKEMKTWQLVLLLKLQEKKPTGRWILVGLGVPENRNLWGGLKEPKFGVKDKLKPTKRTWQGSLMKKESHTVIRQK